MSELAVELQSKLFSLSEGASLCQKNEDSSKLWRERLTLLQRHAWLGNMANSCIRGLCWRLFFGILSNEIEKENFSSIYDAWCSRMTISDQEYQELKLNVIPNVAKVEADPLSSLSVGSTSVEWDDYNKKVELATFIGIDLDRLYMQGIEDEYFEENERKKRLHSVLYVWALIHPEISYRQGMHELAGAIYYVLETEMICWKKSTGVQDHPLRPAFDEKYLESHVFWLYSKVVNDILPLYDPKPMTAGSESLPPIVDYCTRIQEHFLRQIDPELCEHLESTYIQSQIYGLRWARLLLAREFPMTENQALRLWDYMFATCYDEHMANNTAVASQPLDTPRFSEDSDDLLMMSELKSAQASVTSASKALKARYGNYSILMGVLGDFMLAMILHIRNELMQGDANEVLGLLMRYPKVHDITPIMDLADMLRRGVLSCEAHIGSKSPKKEEKFSSSSHSPVKKYANAGLTPNSSSKEDHQYQQRPAASPPTWLLSNPLFPVINTTAINVGKRVTEQINAVANTLGSWRTQDDSAPSSNNSTNNANQGDESGLANESNPMIGGRHTRIPASTSVNSSADSNESSSDSVSYSAVYDPLLGTTPMMTNPMITKKQQASSTAAQQSQKSNMSSGNNNNSNNNNSNNHSTGHSNSTTDGSLYNGNKTGDSSDSSLRRMFGRAFGETVSEKTPLNQSTSISAQPRGRESVGVDLSLFEDYASKNPNRTAALDKKTGNMEGNNAVGDRIMDLVDFLEGMPSTSLRSYLEKGENLQGDELNQRCDKLHDSMRMEVSLRLRDLSLVACGKMNITDYDSKHRPPSMDTIFQSEN